MIRWLALSFLVAIAAAQTPPQSDLPYLKHADTLVPTEASAIKSEKDKDDTRYTIDGAASPARTPLSLPILLLKADHVDPLKLQLIHLRTAESRREITASEIKKADVLHVAVTRLDGGVFRLAVSDSLDSGEYMLVTPGFDRAFCFAID